VTLQPGLCGRASTSVDYADSAAALGSGDLPVLATPRVVALCEQATVDAVSAHLEPGHTTVGVHVEIKHIAPTAIGGQVRAAAELIQVEGRSLTFAVVAHDETTEIANGTVVRMVVERSKFLERLGRGY